MDSSEAKRLKQLEDENRKPETRGSGADAGQPGAERRALKKLVAPAGLRAAVSHVEVEYEMSERHACRLLGLARSTHRYRARRGERDAALRAKLKELGRKAHAVRVSKADGAVGAGRACGQSQASVSAVSGGGFGDEDPAPASDALDGNREQGESHQTE